MYRLMAVATTAAIAVLTGCAGGYTHIVLQNPETKQMAKCKGDGWANWRLGAAAEECAKGYEKVGFVRMSEY